MSDGFGAERRKVTRNGDMTAISILCLASTPTDRSQGEPRQEDTMELRLFGLAVASDQCSKEDEGNFVSELTTEELAWVGGGVGAGEELPKET